MGRVIGIVIGKDIGVFVFVLIGRVDSVYVNNIKNVGMELSLIYNEIVSVLVLLRIIICWKWN